MRREIDAKTADLQKDDSLLTMPQGYCKYFYPLPSASKKMSLLVRSKNLLVICVPGTGSTSLEAALLATGRAETIGNKHSTLDELIASGHLRGDRVSDMTILCVVRNPFDMHYAEWMRCRKRWVLELDDPNSVGGWSEEKRKMIKFAAAYDFPDYVEKYMGDDFESGRQYYMFEDYATQANFIWRFEELDHLPIALKERFNLDLALPHLNQTAKKGWYWQAYDARSRQIISRISRDEIYKYGYAF